MLYEVITPRVFRRFTDMVGGTSVDLLDHRQQRPIEGFVVVRAAKASFLAELTPADSAAAADDFIGVVNLCFFFRNNGVDLFVQRLEHLLKGCGFV